MIVVLAALLSGAMFYLSQGLDDVWALAWFAPAPLLWLAYGKVPAWQVMLASVAAILAGAIYALQAYRMMPPVAFLVVLGPQVVLFPFAVLFARVAGRRTTLLATLFAFPVCWTAFEFLSEYAAPNGTFGSFAYSQMSAPVLIQSASLFGLYSVTFLICLSANALAMAFVGRSAWPSALAGFAICAASVTFGLVRLAQPQPDGLRVAAMVDETAWSKASRARTLSEALSVADAYADDVVRAANQGARFVVMPEGGIVTTEAWRPAILARLVAASRKTGVQIIAGVYQASPHADLAFSIAPDGAIQQYDKRHLIPVLEDMFTPGRSSGWIGGGRSMEICKDMDFPDTIRRDAARGSRLMGVPAGDFVKDAWLHARMAIMRGVEDGFALVRAAGDGMVTASDAEGRVVAAKIQAPSGLTMTVAELPLGPGPTLYTRISDAFAWLCVALTLLIGAHVLHSRRRPSAGKRADTEAQLSPAE
ncbi:MAG: hypothetical protein JOZ55_10565 [Alphaproteobacteria bacterium]|nr:hypothetical protein [Alphaproteobacteria bacterium]